jgi:hypothetical protein
MAGEKHVETARENGERLMGNCRSPDFADRPPRSPHLQSRCNLGTDAEQGKITLPPDRTRTPEGQNNGQNRGNRHNRHLPRASGIRRAMA